MRIDKLVPALAGVVAGLGGALLVGAWSGPRAATVTVRELEATPVAPEVVRVIHERAPGDAIVAPPEREPVEAEAPAVTAAERHAALAAAHARETLDPVWAGATGAGIDEGLRAAAGDGAFTVVGVDCRERTCVAELEWPDFATAAARWPEALHAPVRASCATGVLLDPPADGAAAGPYRASVIYECGR
jgi:hypothetical protein